MFKLKNRFSVSQAIIDDVIKLINTGELKTNDFLPTENVLAERYKVSRNTIREALRVLEAYGVVETAKRNPPRIVNKNIQAGMAIAAIHVPDNRNYLKNIQEFRLALEYGLAESILFKVQDAHIERLKEINLRIEKSDVVSMLAKLDFEFHQRLIEVAQNILISSLYYSMHSTICYMLELGKDIDSGKKATVEGHKQIIAALEQKDLDALRNALHEHFEYYHTLLDKQEQTEALQKARDTQKAQAPLTNKEAQEKLAENEGE